MMNKLTARQQDVYDFIASFQEATGLPPTRAEIAKAMGFRSVNAAGDHLKALYRKGVIDILPGASRGIRLMRESGLPLIGRVAAGSPILAQEHIERHYPVNSKMFSPTADYLLRIQGESMQEAGILDGDLLAVHKTQVANNGQIVVARLGDEVTVKRFKRRGNKVELHPENSNYSVTVIHLQDELLTIEGIGVGVIRSTL